MRLGVDLVDSMKRRLKAGDVMVFKASHVNTGAVTINKRRLVTLTKNGEPLKAGDLIEGEEVTFDRETGAVQEPKH